MIFDQQEVVSVKKILMPIDRSEYNRKIVAYAKSLSKAWGAEITAIHVIHVGSDVGYSRNEAMKRVRAQEAKRPAEDLLNEIALLATKEGVRIKKDVIEENETVGKAIIDYAKKNDMDVIVIGTKGMTAAEEYFFGSVAKEVIHHVHCPVFAIR
jgi:nucleotide-binding universal stress UspA family protein